VKTFLTNLPPDFFKGVTIVNRTRVYHDPTIIFYRDKHFYACLGSDFDEGKTCRVVEVARSEMRKPENYNGLQVSKNELEKMINEKL